MLIAAIALAAKGIAVILPIAGAALVSVNLKVIALTSSLMGLKIALAKTGIGLLVIALGGLATAFIKARGEAKAFQDLITSGGQEDVQKAYDKQLESIKKIEAELNKGNKRSKTRLFQKLEEAKTDLEALQTRLDTLKVEEKITAEKEKQNEASKKAEEQIKKNEEATKKLKEKFMEIGKSVEEGIVQNLTDAVMGTQTLGQAAVSVLNNLKR